MYFVRHWWGEEEKAVPHERFESFLSELASSDREHPDVSLRHDSEWVLSYGKNRTVTFENVEEGEPRHMTDVPPAAVLELWRHLADGDLQWLEQQPWKEGYGK
jgi:hypothetical protein